MIPNRRTAKPRDRGAKRPGGLSGGAIK
jgi:hypothetical protein